MLNKEKGSSWRKNSSLSPPRPPAARPTWQRRWLKNLKHIVYLDKDTLIVLSKQIFKVAGQPYDRSSAFFQQNIRDYEYDCVLDLAMEALDYDDIV